MNDHVYAHAMGIGAPHPSGDPSRGTKGRDLFCSVECGEEVHPGERLDVVRVPRETECFRCHHPVGARFIVAVDCSAADLLAVILALRMHFGLGLPEANVVRRIGYVGDEASAFEMEFGRADENARVLNAIYAERAKDGAVPFSVRRTP